MAIAIQITQYQAEDGSLFTSAAECDAHDFKLKNGAEIDAAAEAFVNTIGAIDRSRNMKTNVVGEFLAFYLPWVEAGKPVVERTVFDTPKPEEVATVVDGEAAPVVEAPVAVQETAEGEPELF